jgi:hypothetical protein
MELRQGKVKKSHDLNKNAFFHSGFKIVMNFSGQPANQNLFLREHRHFL